MKFRRSLQVRIIVAFCLFGAFLGSVYAAIVYISLDRIDDHLVDNRLRDEVIYFTDHYKYYNLLPRPTSLYISAYMGTDAMPLYVADLVSGLADGLHEAYLDENEYHIAIETLPGQGKKLYLLYDVGALEFTETRKLDIGVVLFGGVFVLIGLGWWIGRLTSKRIIAPVVHLSQQVSQSGPESLPTELSRDFIDDEVGTLAAALEQSMKRVEDFVAREHQFSRDASHELRTPVTVIKGAVELLQRQLTSHDASVLRPLGRIERQVNNMERIIEALLWLSREKTQSKNEPPFSILPLVRDVIEENRNLIAGKSVDLKLVANGDPILHVPAPLFQIALTNLIQNAIHYTVNGLIIVNVLEDRVLVSDSGSGIEGPELDHIAEPYVRGDSSNGFGLGLSIVDRLCSRFGWHLEIQSQVGKGTTAQLIFKGVED